jgi:CheY-like chemotaxis protein
MTPTASGRATILAVDDEPVIRELMARFLEPEGYEVVGAGCVAEALAILAARRIQLILLDLHMPGAQDGEDLLFALRDQGNDVPVVVVSGWIDEDSLANRPECVCALLQKPVEGAKLVAVVNSILG